MTGADIVEWRKRKAEIIKRYGDADTAAAPCAREKLLLAAVEPWRTKSEEWTLELDGWRDSGLMYREMPTHALQAIKTAYPLPTTFAEAKAEDDYWRARNSELEDVLIEDGAFAGDIALDLVAEVRAAIVRDLALHELHITNVIDMHERFAMYREAGVDDPRVEDALFRDLAAMVVAVRARPSMARTDTPSDATDRIRTALNANPSRSDRDIARSCHCSPTTVGRLRAALGLRSSTRAVSRGGRTFEMRVAAAQAP